MSTNFYDLVEKTLCKISTNLLRDYEELEYLQSGSKSIARFIEKSQIKTSEILEREIDKLPEYQFIGQRGIRKYSGKNYHIFYSGIKGIINFSRAIPDFGFFLNLDKVIINNHIENVKYKSLNSKNNNILNQGNKKQTLDNPNDQILNQDNLETYASIICLPGQRKIFFVENGKGSWLEKINQQITVSKHRTRVSNASSIQNTLVNYELSCAFPQFKNSRKFGCNLTDIALYITGRLDGILIETKNLNLINLIELYAKESGGICIKHKNGIIATNRNLVSNFK